MQRSLWILGLLLLAAFFLATAPAGAEVDGNCTGQINGVDVAGLDSGEASQAIVVAEGANVSYNFSSPAGVTSWSATLQYGPSSRVVAEGSSEAGLSHASGEAAVSDYAWLGVGLYRLEGDVGLQDGSSCSAAVLVLIEGNPLTTLLGATGALAAVGGATGLGFLGWGAWKGALVGLH